MPSVPRPVPPVHPDQAIHLDSIDWQIYHAMCDEFERQVLGDDVGPGPVRSCDACGDPLLDADAGLCGLCKLMEAFV